MPAKSSNGTHKKGPGVPIPVPAKGTTRAGKPRQRGYRTYYGLRETGELIRFDDYNARELAIKDGHVRRVSAHEAREIESRGTLAVPISTRLTRTPIGPFGASRAEPGGLPGVPPVSDPMSTGAVQVSYGSADDPQVAAAQIYGILGRIGENLQQLQSLLAVLVRR